MRLLDLRERCPGSKQLWELREASKATVIGSVLATERFGNFFGCRLSVVARISQGRPSPRQRNARSLATLGVLRLSLFTPGDPVYLYARA